MSITEKQVDPRFQQGSIVAPIAFMTLFILVIYSFLFAGLLRLASYNIEIYQLTFFANLGILGEAIVAILIMLAWIAIVLIIAIIPYKILRAKGQFIMAEKIALITIFLLFHIFTFPWICWRMIRNNSPFLRQRYRKKLKAMVNGSKMQERKKERYERRQKNSTLFNSK